jgi:phosphatidylglycerophosphate synthase
VPDPPVEPPSPDPAAREAEPAREQGAAGTHGGESISDPAARARTRARRAQKITFARLSGLDRSGPPPPQTQAGQPLRPWTLPNAIGFVRLALIPVFGVVALSSADGTSAGAAALFAVIGWGDYADGIAARVTGQYSRLGALMDPVTDRLLAISGVVVCWHFELLPRWALAVLVARELSMLALGRYGLAHGVELRINWPGRLSVAPVMGGFFFAMVGLGVLGEVLFYIGLALALVASVLYVRDGRRQARDGLSGHSSPPDGHSPPPPRASSSA